MATLTQPAVPRLSRGDLAGYIDHSALKPETTIAQITQLCDEALHYRFMAVCVNPVWVKRCMSFHDVALMREVVGPNVGVTAAGRIRTYADMLAMIEAGANRVGASASVKIMQEADQAVSG